MARAAAGFARTLAAGRLLKDTSSDEALVAASQELRKAAGAWKAIDDCAVDLDASGAVVVVAASSSSGGKGKAAASATQLVPPEASGVVARALESLALATADRLAVFKSFASPTTPASLPARLCAGAAQLDVRALDLMATAKRPIASSLLGAACGSAACGRAAADALWARAVRERDEVGKAVGLCKRGVLSLTAFVDASKGGRLAGGASSDTGSPDGKLARKYAPSAPAEFRDLAKTLAAAVKRRFDAYERDNRTVYFEAVPANLDVDAPLNLAKPICSAAADASDPDVPYELAEVAPDDKKAPPEKTKDASSDAPEPALAPAPPPPSYDEAAKTFSASGSVPAAVAEYAAIRVTLPAGYGPGDRLVVEGPDGGRLETVVPAGAKAGDSIEVHKPAKTVHAALGTTPRPATTSAPVTPAAEAPPSYSSADAAPPAYGDLSRLSLGASTSSSEPPNPFAAAPAGPPATTTTTPAPSASVDRVPSVRNVADDAPFVSCDKCTFNNALDARTCAICGNKLT
mmetsp:Transcript_6837/g.28540  ORF Transcript_6837/g.28540 Transcript_6837/m.28540 type:complete len:518 (-) Transcript_6837:116-1669(-)